MFFDLKAKHFTSDFVSDFELKMKDKIKVKLLFL